MPGFACGRGSVLPAATLGWLGHWAEPVWPGRWPFLTARVGGANKAGTDLEEEWAGPAGRVTRGQGQSLF